MHNNPFPIGPWKFKLHNEEKIDIEVSNGVEGLLAYLNSWAQA